MSLRKIFAGALLATGLALTSAMVASAQQPGPAPRDEGQQQELPGRMGRHRGMGKRGPGGHLRLFSELNLTDAQKEQLRAIRERFEANTRTQREELRKARESRPGGVEPSADEVARVQALHNELDQAMRGMHQEMINVLTAEQRAQLEQLIRERKARREERRGRLMNQPGGEQQE